jgi:hypothetical protein
MGTTAKVGNIISYRYLSPELDADQGPIAEDAPELELSFGHLSPHAACAIENYWIGGRFRSHDRKVYLPARIALDASALTRPTI